MTDSRLTPWRPEFASRTLEGQVAAQSYVDPVPMSVIVPAVGIYGSPSLAAELQDQTLFGEVFDVLRQEGDWAWGQARRDGYVGFVQGSALSTNLEPATHQVSAIRTYAFATPNIKAQATGPYSLNSLVTLEAHEGRFVKALNSGWFVQEHLAPIGRFETDPVVVAERFMGAAYLWGGRESQGLDCSGLVQQALLACGRACPRDTDMQQALGKEITQSELARGDLVFWRGHVAIMLDDQHILHANAHHMAVEIEPLSGAISRIAAGSTGRPTSFRRI